LIFQLKNMLFFSCVVVGVGTYLFRQHIKEFNILFFYISNVLIFILLKIFLTKIYNHFFERKRYFPSFFQLLTILCTTKNVLDILSLVELCCLNVYYNINVVLTLRKVNIELWLEASLEYVCGSYNCCKVSIYSL
jgi:hypothetical protein